MVLDKLVNLKKLIEHTLPECNVVISNLITRTDNGKASLTVIETNKHLHGLQMDVIDTGNVTSNKLNRGGLHLNPRGLGKLAINFIRRIKKFVTTWRVTGSFHKASRFDTEVNFRFFVNLGFTEKWDKSAINQLNGTNSEESLKNDALNKVFKKNPNLIMIAHLNINSIRNKFEMVKEVVGNKIDFLLISET